MKFLYVVCVFCILQTVYTNEDSIRRYLRIKLCMKYVSYRVSRKVPYQETFKEKLTDSFYTNNMRWNSRNEFHLAMHTEKICCTGYKEVNDDMCEPICNPPCGNGTCILPYTCNCNPGYSFQSSSWMQYRSNTCVPDCAHTCLYGNCIAPELCACDKGYSLSDDGYTCKPVCNSPCETGQYCIEPNHCICLPGYFATYDIIANDTIKICKPLCNTKCTHGDCVNNTCVCHDGYETDPDDLFECKPKCDKGCSFGTCIAPNECVCFSGYRLKEPHVCEPFCSKPCVMSTCVAPETCNCINGYGLLGNSSVCEPICHPPCINGKCTAPNTCTCNEGYQLERNNKFTCEIICNISCKPYGSCLKPNECTCRPGYRLTNQTKAKGADMCELICDAHCINGVCDDSGACQCHEGYVLSDSHKHFCEPICKSGCKNGTCIHPDVCICDTGHRLSKPIGSKDQECVPRCINCNNGKCVSPYVCECFAGYERKIHGCKPVCTMCNNGTCVAPEVCKCNYGFILEQSNAGTQRSRSVPDGRSGNVSRCVPSCKNCDNGECVAPNECRCHAGYLKIGGTCVYACESSCANHSKCIAEKRTCECNHGWIGDGVHCEPAMCVLILDNNKNRTDTLRIEKQDVEIEYILKNNPTCPECINKLNNTTLCFKMNINDMKDATQIGCLMDGECLQLRSQYRTQKKIIKLSGIIIGLGILIVTGVMVTYILLRKYSKVQNIDVRHSQSTLMQGLIEEEY